MDGPGRDYSLGENMKCPWDAAATFSQKSLPRPTELRRGEREVPVERGREVFATIAAALHGTQGANARCPDSHKADQTLVEAGCTFVNTDFPASYFE